MNVVLKPFKTPLGCYVYDRETNSVLRVNDKEYASFKRIYEKKGTEEDLKTLKQYEEKGYCKETRLKRIEHNDSHLMEFHLKHGVKKMTLQVTQNCNLRCQYCIYSGKYEQRVHENRAMSIEVMKRAIDFMMTHSSNISEKINIGFFGGEPLLEFKKIKESVEYIQKEYAGKKVYYSITTNGTLFTEEILKFMDSLEMYVTISLDGPEEIHNIHRVFANGEGSFKKIMDNVSYIKENYPNLFKRIGFNTVVAPQSDYQCIHNFFHANDVISDQLIMTTTLNTNNAKENITYDDKYHIKVKYEKLKLLFSKIELYDKDKVSKIVGNDFATIKRIYDKLNTITNLPESAHPSGPCTPGVLRPLVDIDGNIFVCERVSEMSDNMKIGHIDTGYDMEKVQKLLNIGKITENECKNCWSFIHCRMCGAVIDNLNEFSRDKKLMACNGEKDTTLASLKTICFLREYHYNFKEEIEYAEYQ